MNDHLECSQILLESASAGESIRALYLRRKSLNGKYSLAWICHAAGIPSKGYLSDVMSNKRHLDQKYGDGLANALGLDGVNAQFFNVLLRYERETRPAAKERLAVTLKKLRAALQPSRPKLLSVVSLFHFTVLSAIDLFKGQATRTRLKAFFGKTSDERLNRTLDQLVLMGVLQLNKGVYSSGHRYHDFTEDPSLNVIYRVLREAYTEGAEKLDKWFPEKDRAHFESLTMCVHADQLPEHLTELRGRVRGWCAEMDSSKGDEILRLNIQVYPVRR